ncbi:MAG: adaptor protein MecA [Clostridia bacterium]|nr:adaptor protein MecA [Clostridia bacterium]
MNIQPIGNNKFIVILSREDLTDLDITYDTMDYSDIETRRVIWTILDRVRSRTGKDIDPSGNLIIEAAPDSAGGCILIFTVPVSKSNIGTVISKSNPTQIFEFENINDLLDVLTAARITDGKIYTDGKKYRAEFPTRETTFCRRIIEEFGKFVGCDSLTAASTHEHWQEISKSTS